MIFSDGGNYSVHLFPIVVHHGTIWPFDVARVGVSGIRHLPLPPKLFPITFPRLSLPGKTFECTNRSCIRRLKTAWCSPFFDLDYYPLIHEFKINWPLEACVCQYANADRRASFWNWMQPHLACVSQHANADRRVSILGLDAATLGLLAAAYKHASRGTEPKYGKSIKTSVEIMILFRWRYAFLSLLLSSWVLCLCYLAVFDAPFNGVSFWLGNPRQRRGGNVSVAFSRSVNSFSMMTISSAILSDDNKVVLTTAHHKQVRRFSHRNLFFISLLFATIVVEDGFLWLKVSY